MIDERLATALAGAVADRALDRLGSLLTPDVRLRGLLPGGAIEAHGRDDVLSCFHHWFAGYRTITLEDLAGDLVGDRVLVHYKFLLDQDTEPRVVSQTLLCTVWEGLVGRVDLLCSGFRECT